MLLAILQARVSSSRFPRKVLAPLLEKPMILRQIERVRRAGAIDRLLLATSDDPSDAELASLCEREGVECYRGSLQDVLDRFYHAAVRFEPRHVVRLTGDCPLADPSVIDAVVYKHLREKNDYTSNTLVPTFPDGLDVEVFRFPLLEEAWRNAELPSEREHVTPFMYKRPETYKLGNLEREGDNLQHLRWTVDEPEDLIFVAKIYQALYPSNPSFTTQDVLEFFAEHQEVLEINNKFIRNEGLLKSAAEDKTFLEARRRQ